MKLQMGDNSMMPTIQEGDTIVLDKGADIKNLDIVLVSGSTESGEPFQVIRRIYKSNGYIALIADTKDTNENYIGKEHDFKIYGKITDVERSLS